MRRHKLFYGSAYDRGLEILLSIWPDIRQRFPDATLDVAYGWDWFRSRHGNDPVRMKWMGDMELRLQAPGVTDHGRIGQTELAAIRRRCGIWAYPCTFFEIQCITALETQGDGCVPCVVECGALGEVVRSGVTIPGDAREPATQMRFLAELLALMNDGERWAAESANGIAYAQCLRWQAAAEAWLPYFA